MGLVADPTVGPSTVTLQGLSLSDNPLAALYLEGPGRYELDGCEVLGGEGVDHHGLALHGDGLFVQGTEAAWASDQGLFLTNTAVHGASRAGLLLHGATATLVSTDWQDNEVDLVQQGCTPGLATPTGADTAGTSSLCPDRDLPWLDLDFELILTEPEVEGS